MSGSWLWPDWPAPTTVGAAMSLRGGGASVPPWASFNLGAAVGDDPAAVAENRHRFAATLGARPAWLRQVHGSAVRRLRAADGVAPEPADAAWTSEPGLACTVLVADCLPVLFALDDGQAVAAAHAGWRGLAAGVLEATVAAVCGGTGAGPERLLAWLGPCIGPSRFEVGEDVLHAFGQELGGRNPARFVPRQRPDGSPRWLCRLQQLARDRLEQVGVLRISGTDACTFEDPSRFFSFRRDGVTGRHAVSVWRR